LSLSGQLQDQRPLSNYSVLPLPLDLPGTSWSQKGLSGPKNLSRRRLFKIMLKNWFKENRIAIIVILTLLLVGWILFKIVDSSFFRWVVIVALSCISMFLIWSRKHISNKIFLCVIIVLSLCIIGSFINFKNLGDLLIYEDHPRYYSTSVECKDLFIKHGTPFGFNHNFQGGIPTFFYLRSCFWELIPFSFFLGDQLGYQVMIIFFIVLIPLSLFFLVFELTKDEQIAKLVAFISVFQVQPWPFLYAGMTSTLVAMPLSFLSILFFLKYVYNKKYYLFPLLFFYSLLFYTHLVIFAITSMFLAIIFIYKLITQREVYSDFKKLLFFGLLHFLICLPFYYNLFNYASFLRACPGYFREKTLLRYIFSMVYHFIQRMRLDNTMKLGNKLFLSILFLLCFYHTVSNPKQRLILRNALIFSTIVLILSSFGQLPHMSLLALRLKLFEPYIAIFNALVLIMLLPIHKTGKIFGSIILLFIIIQPPHEKHVKTVNTISEIDNKINAFISPGDFALFENSAQASPAKHGKAFDKCSRKDRSHWLTYLQKDLGVKFFSQIGDDAHPFNNLRHMYITNGLFKGERLGMDNEIEFIKHLRDWGVNKACIWSPTAKRFFDDSRYFKLLGESEKYTCYSATYEILPEVRLNKGGTGRLIDEGPFSFKVFLENVSEIQTVIINKNYFNFWSAYDEEGNQVSLRKSNQKICFDTAHNGYIFFKYRKGIFLNLISLLAISFTIIFDVFKMRFYFQQKYFETKREH